MRLWLRLFLLNAALIVAALAAVLAIQYRAFNRGLADYVATAESRRVEALAQRLGDAYSRHGGWEFLRRDPREFRAILEPNEQPPPPPPPRDRGGPGGPPGERPGPPPPRRHELLERLSLFDLAGGPIVGPRDPARGARAFPVTSGGAIVATLYVAPAPAFGDELVLSFAGDQVRTALVAGAAAVALGLVASLLFGRRLFAPLRRVVDGAGRLADGDYGVRVDESGGAEAAELARDFNRLALALDRQRTAQREWIADISHELRTPLAVLQGEISALRDGVRPVSDAALASLHAEGERLTRLVDDLYQLSTSDIGALAYRFEAVDVRAVLHEVAQTRGASIEAAGLSLELELPGADALIVRADERRLVQLFDNLLANSARYTDRGGRVRIVAERCGAEVRVRVDDSAPGVPREALPRLFDRLYRVEGSRSRDAGGAGLGLALASNIVVAHGGRIVAADSPLGGLRIEVGLPGNAHMPS